MNLNSLLDVVIVAIICLSVWRGKVNGLIKTLFHTFSYIIAFFCARLFCEPLSVYMGRSRIYDSLHFKISEMLSGIDLSGSVSDMAQTASGKLSAIIQTFNIDVDSIINNAVATQENVAEEIAGSIATSLSIGISKVLAFVVVFIAALILLKVAASLLDLIAKLPVLNVCNRIGGMVIGGVKGVFLCWIMVQVLAWLLPVIAPTIGFNISETFFAKFFYRLLAF